MPETRHRVLVIDDDEIDREHIRRILRSRYEVSEAATGEIGLRQAIGQQCVLIDYRLPDHNGIDLITPVASGGAAVIMLTGRGNESVAVEAMRRGCTDYLVKGAFEEMDLIRAIDHAITATALRQEIERQRHHLKQHASELERVNAELQQFIHAASHDLQEPLRTIAGFADLLRERFKDRLDTDGFDWLGRIVRATQRMSELIDDLKTYTNLEASEQRFEMVSLNDVIYMVVENLQRALTEGVASVHYDTLPTVLGDRAQLVQLFQNLIGNATKFSHPDRLTEIRIEAIQRENQWDVSVIDNGIGIDPAQHEKIFEMFHRVYPSSRYPGTGMGLALCRRIAERHEGKVTVESVPHQGSTFHVWLPAVAQE